MLSIKGVATAGIAEATPFYYICYNSIEIVAYPEGASHDLSLLGTLNMGF